MRPPLTRPGALPPSPASPPSRRALLGGGLALGAGLAVPGCAHRASAPGAPAPGTFVNPILPGDWPDPSVLRVGEDFYMTHSSFNYAPGLLVWHSRDLVHWRPLGHALPDYDGDVWAPDLVRHGDRFHVYYPASPLGASKTIRVVTAPSPAGPWSKPVDLGVAGIDPGHVVGPDGRRWLHFSGGRIVPLTPDGLAAAGPPRKVFEPWPIPADWPIECVCLEAPKLLFKDGWYHLIVAQGGTAGPPTSHMVVSARSRTPEGPWESSPHNPIVHTKSAAERWWSRGHGTLVDTPDGRWWIAYHGYERGHYGLGRQTLLEPVEWTADGWFRVPPGHDVAAPQRLPLPPAPLPPPSRDDDFAGPALAWPWQFWGEHDRARTRFEAGGLALAARGEEGAPGGSAPLAMVVPDRAWEASVDVELRGDAASAGLLLFYSPECLAGLGLGPGGVKKHMRVGAMKQALTPAPGRRYTMRVRSVDDQATFTLADEQGRPLLDHPHGVDATGFNHNVFGGFVSLRVALFAAGRGEAVFRRFRYRAL